MNKWDHQILSGVQDACRQIWDYTQRNDPNEHEKFELDESVLKIGIDLNELEQRQIAGIFKLKALPLGKKSKVDDLTHVPKPKTRVEVVASIGRLSGVMVRAGHEVLFFPRQLARSVAEMDSEERYWMAHDDVCGVVPHDASDGAFDSSVYFESRRLRAVFELRLFPPVYRYEKTNELTCSVRIGFRFFKQAEERHFDSARELSPVGKLEQRAFRRFDDYLDRLVQHASDALVPEIFYSEKKEDTYIIVSKRRYTLTGPQYAFLVTLIETALENDNQPQRDRDITMKVVQQIKRKRFESFGDEAAADGIGYRMHHVLRSKVGWKVIIEAAGRGSYRVSPRYMVPPPSKIV